MAKTKEVKRKQKHSYTKEEKIKILNDIIFQIKLENKSVRGVFQDDNPNKPKINRDTFYEWLKKDKKLRETYDDIISKTIQHRKSRIVHDRDITGVIYFIKLLNNDNVYKIGFSTNHKRRLRDISSGLPYNIEILRTKESLFALDIEQDLHNKYDKYHIKGEWLRLEQDKVNEIINYLDNI